MSAEYYDIVLIGRTGQGKSTLGNKLLNVDGTAECKIRCFEDSTSLKRFIQADEMPSRSEQMLSVTTKCKLLANNSTNIRVLDIPGFSDSGTATGSKLPVYDANLQLEDPWRW